MVTASIIWLVSTLALTQPTLTVLSASEPEDEGVYTVIVFSSIGLETSDPATLEIGK